MKKFALTAVFALCLAALCAAAITPTDGGAPEPFALPATDGRLYGIGSVGKVFTAAAVMRLADEGRLNLDTPLTAYIPGFVMKDERYAQITPRMLLNHSSGLMGMTDDNLFLVGDNDTVGHDRFLGLLAAQTLKHDPGDRSIYCNDGFTLAEILVESVSGMTFTDFLEISFFVPLGLDRVKTPQSDFDRALLAETYLGENELKPQSFSVIGPGGVYAAMEDLCRFAGIFMDGADGSVLSARAVAEMAKNQHRMEIVDPDADTVFRYGLGWDCVEQFPFNRLGIRALSKGGATGFYCTNLTVLPAYNLAAAVATSGEGGFEALVAQEIILAVLEEEGLISGGSLPALPRNNPEPAPVPENLTARAGLYDAGVFGLLDVSFTDTELILTPVGTRNERPMTFGYDVSGVFVSTGGDLLGLYAVGEPGAYWETALRFLGKYLVLQTYEEVVGLGLGAESMPFAEKIEPNPVSQPDRAAWAARNEKEYLLVSEKFSSGQYLRNALAKTTADERFPGYIVNGVYRGSGKAFPATRVVDGRTAEGYQNIPTVMGRDIVNLSVAARGGVEYLHINNGRYMDAAAAAAFSGLGGAVVVGPDGETVWVNVDGAWGGERVRIQTPEDGSWFLYDDRMNCVATSLEKNLRETVILPESGRLAFAGDAGAVFEVR